jgi:hypothetical protein
MSLTRACLGADTIASEAKASMAKVKNTASIVALQNDELPTCRLDSFDTLDLLLSRHIVPH